ncbi:MAG: hypothetical protein LUE98_00325 [Tannerellaceae bacterium]|nr:hypothetical protein [Tannerellaceae bacterium]
MKRIITLLLSATLIWSCSDQNESVLNESNTDELVTKAVVNGQNVSTTNPNLLTDWENIEEIMMSTGKAYTAPWKDNAMTSMSPTFTKDVKKEDGWIMLFHTFKKLNYNNHLNYIVFYNKLTGFLKVFYFEENNIAQNNNGFVWVVKTSNGARTNLFNLGNYYIDLAASKNDQILLSNAASNPAGGIKKGWNGFEWQVPYSRDYKNVFITIDAYNEQVTNYNFAGKTTSTIEGTIVSQSKGGSGNKSTQANASGTPAKNMINAIKSSANLGESLKNLASSNIPGMIKSGFKLIFGSTTVTTTQEVKLSAAGTVTLDGNSTTIGGNSVPPLRFNLYDIMQGNVSTSSSQSMDEGFVFNSQAANTPDLEYLGVWELKAKPVISLRRHTQVTSANYTHLYDNYYRFTNIKARFPEPMKYEYEVQINPDLNKYITRKGISIDYVVLDKINGQSYTMSSDPQSLNNRILYDDNNITLRDFHNTAYSFNNSFDVWIPNNKNVVSSPRLIDWGELRAGRGIAVITVDIEYNYNGKIHTLYQTRSYSADYVPYENSALLPVAIILNDWQPLYRYVGGNLVSTFSRP